MFNRAKPSLADLTDKAPYIIRREHAGWTIDMLSGTTSGYEYFTMPGGPHPSRAAAEAHLRGWLAECMEKPSTYDGRGNRIEP